jgi:hypothetical protein
MTLNQLFFFTKGDLISKNKRWEVICDLLIDLKLLEERIDISVTSKFKKSEEEFIKKNTKAYAVNMIDILLTPISCWTNNNQNIIWFDFDNINELENWVSKKIGKDFKMVKTNSSQHFNCNIKINNEFKEKYDNIYNVFENRKLDKTLL